MSVFHYYIIELDLPEVVGACTIGGQPGFSTPLTCSDQTSYSTAIKTHKFTNTGLILNESDIYKSVVKIPETTPILKAGNGIASRASCSITFNDFIGDPNLASPALVAQPSIAKKGTFFGKLKERNIIANKAVRVKYYERNNEVDTLVRTNHYIATGIKRSGSGAWVITCKDVLYRADDEKSQFPKLITGRLIGDILANTTSFNIQGDIADWTPFSKYTAVVGKDLLPIVNATGTSSIVTLTVARANTINLGSRIIFNEPSDHSAEDEVFRGRKFVNADLVDVIEAIYEDAGISSSDYDGAGIALELDTWLANLSGSIDCIFYQAKETTKVLNDLCATFMLDMWTDTQVGKIKVKATTPWNTTVATLRENNEINYNSISIDEPKSLHYSRAYLQYDKRKLTDNDDDTSFASGSLTFNTDLEGELFYDEEKVKKLGKSIILSNKQSNIESADLTTVRFAQRFSNRPQTISFDVEEKHLTFALGDVVEVVTGDNQDFYGNPKQGVRAQVTQITPKDQNGRMYRISTVTYNPFIGGIAGSDISINSDFDINLFTESGGPVEADTYTFLVNKDFGQRSQPQAITVGSFPSGSIINIVFRNASIGIGKGGDGGDGQSVQNGALTPNQAGQAGGDTLVCTSGVTVNVYLNGSTGDLGNGSYTADGYLYAPGGGAAGRNMLYEPEQDKYFGGGGGGGGQGYVGGVGGTRNNEGDITNADDGMASAAGDDGGAAGQAGTSNDGKAGGSAGRALIKNGATVNIFTSGQTTRFIAGSGESPTTIS